MDSSSAFDPVIIVENVVSLEGELKTVGDSHHVIAPACVHENTQRRVGAEVAREAADVVGRDLARGARQLAGEGQGPLFGRGKADQSSLARARLRSAICDGVMPMTSQFISQWPMQ